MISFYKDIQEKLRLSTGYTPADVAWLMDMWQTWWAITRCDRASWIMVYVSLLLFSGQVVEPQDYAPQWLQDLWRTAFGLARNETNGAILVLLSQSFQNREV